uniref:cytochrome c maturation protein CcmE domain-containing protein n=1 Tax=Bartonella sp. AA86SXKL TaxID=3243441 RepID=UPI0035CFAC5F
MSSQSFHNSPSLRAILKQRKKKRLLMILLCCFVIALAASLLIYAMRNRNTVSFFRMPSEITREDMLTGRSLRLGGFVEKGTVQY